MSARCILIGHNQLMLSCNWCQFENVGLYMSYVKLDSFSSQETLLANHCTLGV
jgi:hypothetical protein